MRRILACLKNIRITELIIAGDRPKPKMVASWRAVEPVRSAALLYCDSCCRPHEELRIVLELVVPTSLALRVRREQSYVGRDFGELSRAAILAPKAGRILQLQLIDHVIIGAPAPKRNGYFSFKEAGVIG
jgi:hypothetical protein